VSCGWRSSRSSRGPDAFTRSPRAHTRGAMGCPRVRRSLATGSPKAAAGRRDGDAGAKHGAPAPHRQDFPYQVAATGTVMSFEDLAGVVAGPLKHAEPGAAGEGGG